MGPYTVRHLMQSRDTGLENYPNGRENERAQAQKRIDTCSSRTRLSLLQGGPPLKFREAERKASFFVNIRLSAWEPQPPNPKPQTLNPQTLSPLKQERARRRQSSSWEALEKARKEGYTCAIKLVRGQPDRVLKGGFRV